MLSRLTLSLLIAEASILIKSPIEVKAKTEAEAETANVAFDKGVIVVTRFSPFNWSELGL